MAKDDDCHEQQRHGNVKPYSLHPLTPEEALHKLMSALKPDDELEEKKPKKGKRSKKK